MGALCCVVASRPLLTIKSLPHSSMSQDDARQWRTNLSFSPAGYTRDDQDVSDESHGFALCSSRSRQSTSLESCFQQSPRWASNSSASGGNEQKPWNVNSIPRSNSSKNQCLNEEKDLDREVTAITQSFRSLLSLSEPTAPWETSSKQPVPVSLTNCSYPQIFCNPVSECEIPKPETHPNSSFMMSTSNRQGSPVEEASPNQSNSTGSNEMLVDVERSNEAQVETPRFEPSTMTHQRCGICKKLLSQRSPWGSYKTLRCGDMPAAGVFPCHHVYHVECLDKVTPTAQTRDPSCPVCSNTIGEQPLVVPETLELALTSLRRSRAAVRSEPLSSSCNDNERRQISRRSQKWKKLGCCLNIRLC
uniref:RING-type domain-containing protein n=2 Tax=Noccaea caerulescens TaxID=107243 RepID=A0A1J3GVF3_NOCCA